MPELPDITAYLSALEPRIVGQPLNQIHIASPFLLRTVKPPIEEFEGHTVRSLHRIGKRIAIEFDNGLWLVLHLMIAGRLHWRPLGAKLGGRNNLAAFDFPNASLVLTEAGSKRRASLHLFASENEAQSVDPGGIDVFSTSFEDFRTALTAENRTLKRALTDPRILSGIGNAYSDEILHAARLSPIQLTQKLTAEQTQRLFTSTRETLQLWIDRLNAEAGTAFPEKVTAFRKEMAVHGRFGQPCPPAARPSSASATPTTRRTTTPSARPAERFSQTAACPASSDQTGPAPWTSWKPSRDVDPPLRAPHPESANVKQP